MRDTVIFIQAASDVKYAMHILNDKGEDRCLLCIVHVNDIYKFIVNDLSLKVEVRFIPSVAIKLLNPITIFSAKKQLKKTWEDNFNEFSYKEIYFFSRFFDWTTSFLVKNFISRKINVFYVEHYDDVSVEKATVFNKLSFVYIKSYILNTIGCFVTGASFITRYKQKYIEFNVKAYPIQRVKPNEVEVPKKYKYNVDDKGEKILFFLQPLEIDFLIESSILKLNEIINILLTSGFTIYLKGHPRLGTPIQYKENDQLKIIPNYIPSEFINTREFNIILGIVTSSLKEPSLNGGNVYSLIKVLTFKDKERQEFFYNYLKSLSNDNISFPESMDQVKALYK